MKYLIAITLAVLVVVAVVVAQNQSYSGATTAWRLGSQLTFDRTVTLADEQGTWQISAFALANLTNSGGTVITNTTFNTYIQTNVFQTFNTTTQNVDYINVSTNTFIDIVTNVTFEQSVTVKQNINVSGKAQFNQIIITNGYFSKTNVWSGPSNTLDVSIYNQGYSTLTPLAITGFINASNSLGSEVKLKIKNIASTNVTIYFTASGDVDRDHVTSQTITNGTVAQIWYNVDPGEGGSTNHVFNNF